MVELSDPKMYHEYIRSCPVSVIHFCGGWNAHDHIMKDRMSQSENSFAESVCFGSVNVDNEEMFALIDELRIPNVPALVYYKNGNFVDMIIGLNQPVDEKLHSLLNQ